MIIRYFGKNADPIISYTMATTAGFLLAVCSCTILPLFVSIWKRGAGLGPAITFLFVAPAINILALTYTGTLIGLDIAIARGLLAIFFAFLIGVIMAKVFGNETSNDFIDENHTIQIEDHQLRMNKTTISLLIFLGITAILLAVLDATIIEGLKEVFSGTIIEPIFQTPPLLQTSIFLLGLSILVVMTIEKINDILLLFLWLVYILMTGTSQITYFSEEVDFIGLISLSPDIMNMVAKLILTSIVIVCLMLFIYKRIDPDDMDAWFTETRFFFKSIFPLIIIGVTIAGFVKFFIPQDLIAALVGQNTVLANLIAVLFGVFMYFPTLMEVPIAKIFLELGMVRGPLLAYLLADPELSIQSILVTRKFLGDKQNIFFVGLVTIFTVIAGLIFGLSLGQGIALW